MKARPLVFVPDLDRSIEFYRLLGLMPIGKCKGNLVELRGHDITTAPSIARRAFPPPLRNPDCLLTFEVDRAISDVAEDLHRAGVELERDVTDEAYGYSIAIRDPDGLLIQINQHDIE